MGKRTSYEPGTFSWVDLATTDAEAAKSFYSELFGWETQDEDAGGGAVYTLCRLGGDRVCGIYGMTGGMRAMGVPPNWTSYVTVEDAGAAAEQVDALGGGVISGPFDAHTAGRMAIAKDPQGAVFALWQPLERIGAERVNDVGCLCMNDLATTDVDAARAFYESLFGWTTETVGERPDSIPLALGYNGDSMNASFSRAEEGVPAHWLAYFTVEDVASTLERTRELDGGDLVGPLEMFEGTIGIARDPQGAAFGLFAGEVDP